MRLLAQLFRKDAPDEHEDEDRTAEAVQRRLENVERRVRRLEIRTGVVRQRARHV